MANTSSRALRLLSLLQNHRFWPGRGPRRAARRLAAHAAPGRGPAARARLPGHRPPGRGRRLPAGPGGGAAAAGGRRRRGGRPGGGAPARDAGSRQRERPDAGRPGQRRHGDAGDLGTVAEAAARALAKVTQVMPARLRRRAEAVAAMTESASWDAARAAQAAVINPDVLASAALACRDSERIRFGYGAASGERTERHVEPHRLVALDRRWYLVAYDLTRNDWRSFRLDRVIGDAAAHRRQVPPADAARRRRGRVRPPEHHRRRRRGLAGRGRRRGTGRRHQGAHRPLGHGRRGRPGRCRVTMTATGQPRLAGDRARRGGRGLPGAVPAGAGRADRRLGRPLQPGDPAARRDIGEVSSQVARRGARQGAIILGIGGDNSKSSAGTFYEGVMTTGYPSASTEAAVQANIVAAGYTT